MGGNKNGQQNKEIPPMQAPDQQINEVAQGADRNLIICKKHQWAGTCLTYHNILFPNI